MATLVPGRGCTLCGGGHLPSRCSELNVPAPEGLPNPDSSSELEHSAAQLALPTDADGGGKRAGNPEPDEDDCLRVKSLVRKATNRVVNIYPNC